MNTDAPPNPSPAGLADPVAPTGRAQTGNNATALTLLRALRPAHWVKNLLLLLPLALAHRLTELPLLFPTLIAVAAFSLCASAVYVLNDLLDLEADRAHPRKNSRPFASGAIPPKSGAALVPLLLAAAFALAGAVLPLRFLLLLALYLLLTTAYSLYFKRKLLLDVLLLAALYTLRLLAGAAATEPPIEVSQWLLAFAMFFFLSLAFAKRYSELAMLHADDRREARGRGYVTDDLDIILTTGPASGYLSVLVLALYIESSQNVHLLYAHPKFLWPICPLLLYWLTRLWFFARRRALGDDPILFALKDRISYLTGALAVALLLLASLKWRWPWA